MSAVVPEVAETIFGDRLGLAVEYAGLLETEGVVRGLIGPREAPRLWDRHLLNCAVVGELISPGATVIDVGSGAGLPGIVLAVARPDISVILVEPLARRTAFLESALASLRLDGQVTVVRGRAEEQAGRLHAAVVTARAVAPLDRLGRWCLPLVDVGGRMLALKGASAGAEIEEHQGVLRRLGGGQATIRLCGAELISPPTTVVEVVREQDASGSSAGRSGSRSPSGSSGRRSSSSGGERSGSGDRRSSSGLGGERSSFVAGGGRSSSSSGGERSGSGDRRSSSGSGGGRSDSDAGGRRSSSGSGERRSSSGSDAGSDSSGRRSSFGSGSAARSGSRSDPDSSFGSRSDAGSGSVRESRWDSRSRSEAQQFGTRSRSDSDANADSDWGWGTRSNSVSDSGSRSDTGFGRRSGSLDSRQRAELESDLGPRSGRRSGTASRFGSESAGWSGSAVRPGSPGQESAQSSSGWPASRSIGGKGADGLQRTSGGGQGSTDSAQPASSNDKGRRSRSGGQKPHGPERKTGRGWRQA